MRAGPRTVGRHDGEDLWRDGEDNLGRENETVKKKGHGRFRGEEPGRG